MRFLKSALKGIEIGFIVSSLAISGDLAKRGFENYRFKTWLYQAVKEHIELEINSGKEDGIYVCMFGNKKTDRSKPLFTDSIVTCCALAIDNKIEDTHYLAHFTSADSKEKIENLITSNFNNLGNLEICVIAGDFPDSHSTRNVYNALRSLDLLKNAKYCQSRSIMIKEGRFYNAF